MAMCPCHTVHEHTIELYAVNPRLGGTARARTALRATACRRSVREHDAACCSGKLGCPVDPPQVKPHKDTEDIDVYEIF